MRRSRTLKLAPSLLIAVSCLVLAPVASAQSGGTGVDPVDGVVATVEYEVEQALNSTNPPPGNGTNPPPGNGTNPPSNGTSPPGNGTTTPSGGTTPPGNGTTPAGNQTTPPVGNQTTTPDGDPTADPDGNQTADPDGNSTASDDNSTAPEDGNETADTGTNSTASPAGGADNSTADANVTVSTSSDGGVGGDGASDNESCVDCAETETASNSTVGDINSSGDGSEGAGGSGGSPCVGVSCDRSRVIGGTPKPGFPMLPLLITLILGPLAGLVVAHYAIRRWNLAKPAKRGVSVAAGPKGPVDAHDPMRQFLMDVKEWKATPQPGTAAPDPTPGSV